MEEQTIQHIEKVENSAVSDSGGWVDFFFLSEKR